MTKANQVYFQEREYGNARINGGPPIWINITFA